jgi:uncharacterized protein DUF732
VVDDCRGPVVRRCTVLRSGAGIGGPNDDALIAALASQAIPISDNNVTVRMGRNMCALLDQGTTRPLLVMKLMKDANLSARQAGFFLGLSASAYCPQYRSTAG